MLNISVGIVGIVLGAFLIIFRKWYADYCLRKQNQLWGFRFGERSVRLTEYSLIFIGLGSIGIGLLALLALLSW